MIVKKIFTSKGRPRYWVDFVCNKKRHQRKFNSDLDAYEYIYFKWFELKVRGERVNDFYTFSDTTVSDLIYAYVGYQYVRYKRNEISYNTVLRCKQIASKDYDIKLNDVNLQYFTHLPPPMMITIKSFFNFIKAYGIVKNNPIKVVRVVKKIPYIAKDDDIKLLYENQNLSEQDKLLIYLAQHTGARICELVTLRINNISRNTIAFVTHEVRGIEKLQTKSGIGRTIKVHDDVVKRIKINYVPNRESYLFWNERLGKRVTVASFRYRFNKNASFGDFHSLRHRAASEWIHGGVDVIRVSKAMGHASVEYTLKQYAHIIYASETMPMLCIT